MLNPSFFLSFFGEKIDFLFVSVNQTNFNKILERIFKFSILKKWDKTHTNNELLIFSWYFNINVLEYLCFINLFNMPLYPNQYNIFKKQYQSNVLRLMEYKLRDLQNLNAQIFIYWHQASICQLFLIPSYFCLGQCFLDHPCGNQLGHKMYLQMFGIRIFLALCFSTCISNPFIQLCFPKQGCRS